MLLHPKAILTGYCDSSSLKKSDRSLSIDLRGHKATIRASEAFGATIDKKNDALLIIGFDGKVRIPDNVLDVANSGTTLRIMTAVIFPRRWGYCSYR